MDSSPN